MADRHTAQLKQLVGLGIQQSANMVFTMRELDEPKHKMSGIQQNLSITNTRIGEVENAISLMGIQVTSLDTKLDRILDLLDKG